MASSSRPATIPGDPTETLASSSTLPTEVAGVTGEEGARDGEGVSQEQNSVKRQYTDISQGCYRDI